ncbi:MAG: VWA domain-containing protein, partial [Deltaproteobacteria bacterium]|nr:VWA domain-containing protein [Deltaproteobacteria bacterium]
MSTFFSQLHLVHPIYLWLLLLLPLLWLRWRRRGLGAVLWRSCALVALVLALAGPEWTQETTIEREPEKIERIFAFDLSRSIPDGMKAWMVEKAKRELGVKREERTFVFAREVKEVKDWERWVGGKAASDTLGAQRTNLEALLSAVLRLPTASRTLFLFTDGWENEGSARRLFLSLPHSGLRVSPLFPAGQYEVANVAVTRVFGPHQGTSGDGVRLKLIVENYGSREVEGALVLRRDGELLRSEAVRIGPGSRIHDFQSSLKEGPLTSFQVQFAPRNPALDRFPQDNQATAWIAVRPKAKVLLLGARASENRYLAEILKRRGFEVTSLAGNGAPPSPAAYAVVIFNNVERQRFSPAYLAEVERQVAAGKAFVMLGGEGSFGPGGYRQTPIERVLPVELREPKKEEKNRAVVLVIDKSGSMREEDKLVYAKEAARAMAQQMGDKDLLGVVGFDVAPFVVVPLSPLARIRASFGAEVKRLKAGGKTYLPPAIVEARRQLERQPANRKHVIILSDGETGGSGGDYVDLVTAMKDELKITVSAVAIGEEANLVLLKRIAHYGGGLFHHTYDPKTLPQIVLEEVQEKPQATPLVEKEIVPVAVRGSEILTGLASRTYPPLRGYIETEIKKGAKLDLGVPRENSMAPLLASWSFGQGKAVAFTTDLHGRWSKDWIGWEDLERFWGRILEWLVPPKESLPPHEIRVNPEGNH